MCGVRGEGYHNNSMSWDITPQLPMSCVMHDHREGESLCHPWKAWHEQNRRVGWLCPPQFFLRIYPQKDDTLEHFYTVLNKSESVFCNGNGLFSDH